MDPIDSILSNAPDIEPSSGFAEGVMRSVAIHAVPAPPFPWARLTSGSAVCVAIAWLIARIPMATLAAAAGDVTTAVAHALAPAATGLAVASFVLCMTMAGLRLMRELANVD